MKTPDALRTLVLQNGFLNFGMHHRLFNLTQVARYLQPQIEARTGKPTQLSALVMSLSRLQREVEEAHPEPDLPIVVKHVTMHSELAVASFLKTSTIHGGLNKLHNQVQKDRGYITLNEGMNDVSVILDEEHWHLVDKLVGEQPTYTRKRLASVGIKFDPKLIDAPGLFHAVFQEMFFQRISIIEVASAGTELIIYIDERDMRLAFDTLLNRTRKPSLKKKRASRARR